MPLADTRTVVNGKYRILRLIGEGGQSRVWLALDVARDLQVAIKEPLKDLSRLERAEVQSRFHREMRINGQLLKLDVPNVVRVWTPEKHGGQPLLVMEYCPGGSLAERLKAGPLSLDEAVRITLELLAALDVAHDKLGLVHRDIKPSNILFGADGRAKLGDFGLAQTLESQRSIPPGRAHPGTPGYMSPEQERTTTYLNPTSDLYTVGCVLFEMLTGKRYQSQRPGTRASTLRAEVPAWLDEIVSKALSEDPWERYETAEEMAAALEAGWQQSGRAEQEARAKEQAELQRREEQRRKQDANSHARAEAKARVEEEGRQRMKETLAERGGTGYSATASLEEKRALNKRLETICWGLFLVMLSALFIGPSTVTRYGLGSIGIGLILLGLNAARYYFKIEMSTLTIILGIIALASGVGDLLGIELPVMEILLVSAGLLLLHKALTGRRDKTEPPS